MRNQKKICPICGKEFRSAAVNAVYCSPTCKNKANYVKKRAEKEVAARKAREKALRTARNARGAVQRPASKSLSYRDPRYWEKYKASLMKYYGNDESRCHDTVNSIPVTAPDFPERVVESIAELGHIFGESHAGANHSALPDPRSDRPRGLYANGKVGKTFDE